MAWRRRTQSSWSEAELMLAYLSRDTPRDYSNTPPTDAELLVARLTRDLPAPAEDAPFMEDLIRQLPPAEADRMRRYLAGPL